ncbi:MAG TPA: hypothetical protein VK361_10530 [Rubrobacteraceae bacterium]|nr:hypothetical protein [Rubrobacteraceae bacterium]
MDAIAKVVEGISAEISSLKEQRHAEHAEAERADERLKELSGWKAPLPSGTFSGEREGRGELLAAMYDLADVLNKESAVLSRTKALAKEAARELDRLILEAEVRYHEAEKRLAQRRYEELCRMRYSIAGEAEQVMANLAEILDRLENLHAEQVRTAADAEEAYLVQEEVSDMIENWLARRLGRWLSVGSPEKYDAPLPELDVLALKPEPERGSPSGVGAHTS